MNFLPPSYIPCEACGGKRFNPQTLAVQYNGKSIGDLLELTIEEAADSLSRNRESTRHSNSWFKPALVICSSDNRARLLVEAKRSV